MNQNHHLGDARYKKLRTLLAGLAPSVGPVPVLLKGSTPGLAPGETTALTNGGGPLSLDDGSTYTVETTVTVAGLIGGVATAETFIHLTTLRRVAGVTTIVAQNVLTLQGDGGGAGWTFVASVGVLPDRLIYTFGTAATTARTNVAAIARFTEVTSP